MSDNKKICWLFAAHMNVSEHNNNGACPCMNCKGAHCHNCKTYTELQWEQLDSSCNNVLSRCQKCQMAGNVKQR